MRNWKAILMLLTVTTALLMPSAAFAAKKYQVTGKVIALDDKSITVQKADMRNGRSSAPPPRRSKGL